MSETPASLTGECQLVNNVNHEREDPGNEVAHRKACRILGELETAVETCVTRVPIPPRLILLLQKNKRNFVLF